MITIVRTTRSIILGTVLAASGFLMCGCDYFPEATFKLSNESRLPKWVTLPPGVIRTNISVKMSYYSRPWGGIARIEVQDIKNQTIKTLVGTINFSEPFRLKIPPGGFPVGYPAYEAITIGGVTDIIEHRKMEPMFYATDDTVVWKQYSTIGCG